MKLHCVAAASLMLLGAVVAEEPNLRGVADTFKEQVAVTGILPHLKKKIKDDVYVQAADTDDKGEEFDKVDEIEMTDNVFSSLGTCTAIPKSSESGWLCMAYPCETASDCTNKYMQGLRQCCTGSDYNDIDTATESGQCCYLSTSK